MFKVAIVGKPNVGKSTLFNRIIAKKQAIVLDEPGVTRDRIYGVGKWLQKEFEIIDTGGVTNKEFSFKQSIQKQVEFAIDEANLVIFLVSDKDGINADDIYVSKLLKKYKFKQVIVVANKCDNKQRRWDDQQYYSLGFGKPLFISSEHGIGIGDLLDLIIGKITSTNIVEDTSFKFCVIGRPNVGKSSLINTITTKQRVIVSPEAHTTRDAIDVHFTRNNKSYTIIDTAGIRRKGKIDIGVEQYSVLRSYDAINRSQAIIFMIDGSIPINEQDEVVGGLAYKANIPTIICVNKWDLVKKTTSTMNLMIKEIRTRFKYLSWAPIIFISAIDNKRIQTIFETFAVIDQQLNMKVNTSALNEAIVRAQILNPPPLYKGARANFSYATQAKGQIPTFIIFGNDPKHVHLSYMRYIENTIRETFGIRIVPITVYYKDKNARIRGIK